MSKVYGMLATGVCLCFNRKDTILSRTVFKNPPTQEQKDEFHVKAGSRTGSIRDLDSAYGIEITVVELDLEE